VEWFGIFSVISFSEKIRVNVIIRRIGGAAKISGAGGIKTNSGMLIAYHNEPARLLNYARKKNLDIIDFKLGEKGVKIEEEN